MQRLRPDIGSGAPPQPTLTVASSHSRCVQGLAPSGEASYGQYITRYNTIGLCIINFRKRYA
jgi:hypothetical protein